MKLLNRGMDKGFVTGLLAFVITKAVHYGGTYLIGLAYGSYLISIGEGFTKLPPVLEFIDSPGFGVIFLTAGTIYVYKQLKINKQ